MREAKDFLSGRSRAVKELLAREMEQASTDLEFERAALYRDRLAALSAVQAQQGINPRTLEEADVFAIHQEGGYSCVEVFFFRTGQNWGNRAYFPRADRSFSANEVLGSFLPQFYEDKPAPRLVLLSHEIDERELLSEALTAKAGVKVEVNVPQRGEKRELVNHALANAREALGRKLANSSSQMRLLQGLATALGLPRVPKRVEVYDNSHIQGTNAVGAMIVAGTEGFIKNQYRKFNIRSEALTPGDDYGMMREVLERRFKRLLNDAPRAPEELKSRRSTPQPVAEVAPEEERGGCAAMARSRGHRWRHGPAQRRAGHLRGAWSHRRLADRGRQGARARCRQGNDLFPDRPPMKLEPRDPVLYFIQRMRDEAHRFVIGSHRKLRQKGIREAGLQEIAGIGPSRKRALLHHFGTLKAIEHASLADLAKVPGISAESARRIYEFFHAASP